VTRAVLTRADVVVSVSHDLGQYLRREMRVPNVAIIPNGVDVDEFHPAHSSRAALTLFSISRLVPRKNIHVLIAAMEQLVNEGAALSLIIAGTGPEEERIQRLAERLPGSVRFLGFVDEARKRSLLADTDVFMRLSARWLSIATLEAPGSGVPCVVSIFRRPQPSSRQTGTWMIEAWSVSRPCEPWW
jgi:phosphatidylinositol alpha-1,6-mannosyltransferase